MGRPKSPILKRQEKILAQRAREAKELHDQQHKALKDNMNRVRQERQDPFRRCHEEWNRDRDAIHVLNENRDIFGEPTNNTSSFLDLNNNFLQPTRIPEKKVQEDIPDILGFPIGNWGDDIREAEVIQRTRTVNDKIFSPTIDSQFLNPRAPYHSEAHHEEIARQNLSQQMTNLSLLNYEESIKNMHETRELFETTFNC